MEDARSGAPGRWRAVERRVAAAEGRVKRFAERGREAARRLPAFLAILFAATGLWILLWAWYDAAILVRAFPSGVGVHQNLDVYWISTWWVVFPISSTLIFRRHVWLPILALYPSGWEDILFYWVQGRAVPAAIAYLPQTPTATDLYLRAAIFLAASVVGVIAARLPVTRIRFVPLEAVMLAAGVLGSFWILVASIPAYLALQRGLLYFSHRAARRSQGAR